MIINRDWSSSKYFGVIISFRNLIKMPLKKSTQCSQPLTSSCMSRSWVYILKVYKKSANSGHVAFLTSGIGALVYSWLILKFEEQISKKACILKSLWAWIYINEAMWYKASDDRKLMLMEVSRSFHNYQYIVLIK